LNILYSNKEDINIEFLKLLLQANIDKSSPMIEIIKIPPKLKGYKTNYLSNLKDKFNN
jgi:hypothetical protein